MVQKKIILKLYILHNVYNIHTLHINSYTIYENKEKATMGNNNW